MDVAVELRETEVKWRIGDRNCNQGEWRLWRALG
jgi:hypothetical protein